MLHCQAQSCSSTNIFEGGFMENDRLAFSRDEVARRLGVSRDSVIRAIAKGRIKIIRFGRRVLIPKAELDRLLEAR
jgi:excisionase family DNA binding protein